VQHQVKGACARYMPQSHNLLLLLNHNVKKGKLLHHDNSEDGPGPGTYSPSFCFH